VRVEPQMRTVLAESIPRQHVASCGAVNAPPHFICRDGSVLVISDTDGPQLG
jgi:hypothetical protein